MGKYVEIIPPSRAPARQSNTTGRQLSSGFSREHPEGIISSNLTRWEANRQARAFGALSARSRAEADYFDAQSGAIDSYISRGRAIQQLAELPEVLAADQARRRADREEEWAEIQHQRQLVEHRRMTELAQVGNVLVEAQQALHAQRQFGHVSHEIAWKKKHAELLGVELDAAERRAMLREVQNETAPARAAQPSESELVEQVFALRQELRADGIDTSKVDHLLDRFGKR